MIKKNFLLIILATLLKSLCAQATFVIESLPDYTPAEDVMYMAGDFNGWNPGDPAFALEKNDEEKWQITTDPFNEGTTILFKFTRGSWETVEKGPQGEEIADRTFTFGNGDTVPVNIHNWADFGLPADSTAAWNVSIMDEEFYMPQLDRYRRIWIYLPPDYHETNRQYPVLYMHDGQNLFEALTSYAGEWEIDETLNTLADSGYQVPIVIGIDHGGIYRTEELTPWVYPEYPTGRGEDYMAFIVETLKPYVDDNYRTLTDREHTGIMGSSLGGLISTYGAMKYQDVFSKSGPFSPAYWINNDSIWEFIHETGKLSNVRFYQNSGEFEGDQYIDMIYRMEDSLRSLGFEDVSSKVIPNGQHNEATWRDDFANGYKYLFASFANGIAESEAFKPLTITPNPAGESISFSNISPSAKYDIKVVDSSGRIVMQKEGYEGGSLDINQIPPGIYVVTLRSKDDSFVGRFVKN